MAGIKTPQSTIDRAKALYAELNSAPAVGLRMGLSEKSVRRYLERAGIARHGHLPFPEPSAETSQQAPHTPYRVDLSIDDGVVLIGSDGHYWPGPASTAHRAFVKFAGDMNPAAVIMNGDALDGARISRHPPIGWEDRPNLIDELRACQVRLAEIENAAPRAALTWNLGNHDARFETRLASVAPEYALIHGFHLKDHFNPRWTPAWATWINDDLVVKHRFKGGVHAPHNNAAASGKSMVTGHLHSAKVTPYTDYNGTRWGVDTGCLADPSGPQFLDYTEDNPKNWRSAFGVFTFHQGVLLQPELVLVFDKDHVEFRGEVIRV